MGEGIGFPQFYCRKHPTRKVGPGYFCAECEAGIPGVGETKVDLNKIFQKCGMVESIPSRVATEFKVEYDTPEKWNTTEIAKEFPGVGFSIKMEADRPGLPFTVHYSLTGPLDQVGRFIGQYADENTKEAYGRATGQIWSGKEWIKK